MRGLRIYRSTAIRKATLPAAGFSIVLLASGTAVAQARHYPLDSVEGLRLHNVTAEPATLHGKRGLRLRPSEEAARQFERMMPEERRQLQLQLDHLAWVENIEFSNGVIEAEIAGAPAPGAFERARGFVGIAFRVRANNTYDAFYRRPTNGRAEDQERRNRSVQYISRPEWPFFRLREESPGKYEAYVDLVPGEWTRIRIEVAGEQSRLYIHDQEQATLIVKDVRSGALAKGAVALWLDPGTVAHFRNLTVDSLPAKSSQEEAQP